MTLLILEHTSGDPGVPVSGLAQASLHCLFSPSVDCLLYAGHCATCGNTVRKVTDTVTPFQGLGSSNVVIRELLDKY